MTMPSKERQTADALVQAFNTMDIDKIIALRTPDCQRIFLPSSMKLGPHSNEAYRANLTAMKSIFSSFQLSVNDVVEGVSQDLEGNERKKIVMFVSARGDTPVGEYVNEYVWRLGFVEGGEKVSEWTEFVDAAMQKEFYPKLRAAVMNRVAAAEVQGRGERTDN